MDASTLVALVAVVASGLVGGLFFGWSVSVIPGTARTDDRTYVSTMQHINRAIVNPGFIIPFLGLPVVMALAAYLHWRVGERRRAGLLLGATVVYLVGVLGVTFGANVPRNNALEAFDLAGAEPADLGNRRRTYEQGWNRWHQIRAAASVATLVVAAAAIAIDDE
ncbi:MAG: anthrone oxygenase family protein [Actinomycetota bacterium]